MNPPPPRSTPTATLFPYPTLFLSRSPSHSLTREPASAGFLRCGCRKPVKGLHDLCQSVRPRGTGNVHAPRGQAPHETEFRMRLARLALALLSDRKSTRLNSSH